MPNSIRWELLIEFPNGETANVVVSSRTEAEERAARLSVVGRCNVTIERVMRTVEVKYSPPNIGGP